MKPAEIRSQINFVELKNGPHLFWRYSRETLCGKDKVHAQRLWWAPVECKGCLAEVGRQTMKDAWPAMVKAYDKGHLTGTGQM